MLNDGKFNEIITMIAETNEIFEHQAHITDTKELGESYIGDLIPVTIIGNKSGKNISLNVIIKLPSVERCAVSPAAASNMFNREILNYSKLLRAYDNLQKTLTDRAVPSEELMTFIKCYFHSMEPYEVIVLEDMRQQGYKIYKEKMFMDHDHIVLVMKEVGKLHALSFILERENPLLYAECKEYSVPVMKDMVIARRLMVYVRKCLEQDCKGTDEKLQKRLLEYLESWCRADELKDLPTKVIIHSDLWRNNILFKYKEGEPDNVCLLDYQIMQVHSPAYDVLYLIATSTDHALRTHHFQHFIEIYYQALTRMLSHFSVDVNEIYTMEQLGRDIKRLAPFVIVRGLFSLRTWYGVGGLTETHITRTAVEGADTSCDINKVYQKDSQHLINDFIAYTQI